jgi:tetratricopeptide (TPR) repeat protein
MRDHYEVLGVNENAEQSEIRKAYSQLIRKYNPEKFPNEYAEIRGAYEVLGNEKLRQEYDANKQHGTEINKHLEIADELFANEEYNEAIIHYKKALILNKNLYNAANMLSLCYYNTDRVEEAITILENTLKRCSDVALFYSNCATYYLALDNAEKAEEYYLKALEIEPVNLTIVKALTEIYNSHDVKRYDDSIRIINKAIDFDEEETFQDFEFLFELAKTYVLKNDIDNFNKVIERIYETVDDDNQLNFAAAEFGRFALDLYNSEVYKYARVFAEGALKFGSVNQDLDEMLRELHDKSKTFDEAYSMWSLLISDKEIHDSVKGPIYYYLFPDEDEQQHSKDFGENIDALFCAVKTAPDVLVDSIEKIRDGYPLLYNYRKEIYEPLYESAKTRLRDLECFSRLADDSSIAYPFKRLAAAWMDDNEDSELYKEIIDEIGRCTIKEAGDSISFMKQLYTPIYEMNAEYLDELLQKCKDNGYGRTPPSKPSSSSGGCYITTAACLALGKPDDCYELQMFRSFRDNWLAAQDDGEFLINEYYRTAPHVVESINARSDSHSVFMKIWSDYLSKCLHFIETRQMDECKKLYMKMFNEVVIAVRTYEKYGE